jgi:hypothetical protein
VRKLSALGAASIILSAIIPFGPVYARGAGNPTVEVTAAVHHDVSAPLSGMKPASPTAHQLTERPLRLTGFNGPELPDAAVQSSTTGVSVPITTGGGFEGIGRGQYGFSVLYAPPDTNGAVGATQYVQWVNTYFAVFDKTTHAIASGFPKPGNAIWAGFGGGCETNNDGDPIAQYDKAANRWILTQFSVSTTPYLQCVAVSTTSDATGTYNRYAFSYGNTQFNDYPKLGVWPDGYYITYNIFNNGATYAGPKACALDRAKMLAGLAATQQCVQLSNAVGPLLPSDLDGSTAPPAGSPNYLVTMGSSTSLNLYKFHVDWTTPANSTFSGASSIAVAAYTRACNGGACVAQPGTRQRLDSLADRLMYRLAYRNFGTYETLVVNHSVKISGNVKNQVVGVRWYELRQPSGASTFSRYQQGTYSPDSTSRWMGSIAMDKAGNIAVGYSASSGSVYPSVRYAARGALDPLNTLSSEITARVGSGSQLPNLSRWGDYSAMTVDPVDDCTFWYTSEYLATNGTWNWNTWITSFKVNDCQ